MIDGLAPYAVRGGGVSGSTDRAVSDGWRDLVATPMTGVGWRGAITPGNMARQQRKQSASLLINPFGQLSGRSAQAQSVSVVARIGEDIVSAADANGNVADSSIVNSVISKARMAKPLFR